MVEFVALVDAAERAGVTLDDVHVSLEHEATSASRHHADLVTRLQPCLPESVDRNSGLMLRADSGELAASLLYFFNDK